MRGPRFALAAASVAVLAAAMLLAGVLGPHGSRVWLLFCGLLAVAVAVEAVAADARALGPALLLALPPVASLVSEGSPAWLVPPLGVLLLVAAELSTLSWECRGPGPAGTLRARLEDVGRLALLGLAASALLAGAARVSPLHGTAAVALAAAGIAGVGAVLFRRSG